MIKKRPGYIKYIKEIDYLKSEIKYRDSKFNTIMIDFINDVDHYASINLPEKYDIKKQQEIYESKKVEEDVIKKHMEENKKKEQEREDAKIEAQKNPLEQKFKKLYKKIVLKTHPDKLIGFDDEEKEYYTQLYKTATDAYKSVDPIEIIHIAYDLNISLPELNDEELSLFDIKINKLKSNVQYYETTYPWVWFHENNGDRKNFILKTYVDKNY